MIKNNILFNCLDMVFRDKLKKTFFIYAFMGNGRNSPFIKLLSLGVLNKFCIMDVIMMGGACCSMRA